MNRFRICRERPGHGFRVSHFSLYDFKTDRPFRFMTEFEAEVMRLYLDNEVAA